MSDKKYKCPECGWIGTEDEMQSDFLGGDDEMEEIWSDWICPNCGMWNMLESYEIVSATNESI